MSPVRIAMEPRSSSLSALLSLIIIVAILRSAAAARWTAAQARSEAARWTAVQARRQAAYEEFIRSTRWRATQAGSDAASEEFIRSSCRVTRYPDLCVSSLSSYAGSLQQKQSELVKAAVKVSLVNARNVSAWATRICTRRGLNNRERGALNDCVENFGDTSDQISESLKELKHLRQSTFRFQMGNVQTWMSAALTNEDSCLDGFQDANGRLKRVVNGRVQDVSKLISNALALANQFATQGGY